MAIHTDRHVVECVLPSTGQEPELGVRAMLVGYPLAIPESMLHDARAELSVAQARGGNSLNPSFQKDLDDFPKAMRLVRFLSEHLLEPEGTDLSFLRSMDEQKGVFVGNLHHDCKYAGYNERTDCAGSVYRPSENTEIWRQIVNLGQTHRYLQIVDVPMREFAEEGIDTDTIRPESITVTSARDIEDIDPDILEPAVLKRRSIIYPIPPYDGTTLPVFEFWASRILHAGITGPSGHFMAAAARWQTVQ